MSEFDGSNYTHLSPNDTIENIFTSSSLQVDERHISDERIKDANFFTYRNEFWRIFKDMDNQKEGNVWKSVDSRPTLTNFHYVVIPMNWNDLHSDPDKPQPTTDKIKEIMDYQVTYYNEMSFGKFTMSYEIYPVTRLSQRSKNPDPNFVSVEIELYEILADDRRNLGSDFDGVIGIYHKTPGGSFANGGGVANVNSNAPMTFIHSWTTGVTRHEIGHNFGHPHHYTNGYLYRIEDEDPGWDGFDMMSGGNNLPISHFHVASKWFFGWVPNKAIALMQPQGPDSDCVECKSSGRYTLYPFDGADNSKLLAIHIPITAHEDDLYSYWLAYRAGSPAEIGLSVHLAWFKGIGGGTFKVYYDQTNYDAYGHTETTDDSFVTPGTCYHISPNIRMLDIHPADAMAIQPVVCVESMTPGESIVIDVHFLDPEVSETSKNSLECGSSETSTLPSNRNQLIHVQNTGIDGVLTVKLCPSSGSANAYFYDRFPHSSQKYDAPLGYGSYLGLSTESTSSCSSLDYVAVNNEAWVNIETFGQTDVDISCKVNTCTIGQKKQGGKCVECSSNDNCIRCEGGFYYFVSKCIVNPTVKEIESSTQWRILTTDDMTKLDYSWNVHDVSLYSNAACTGTKFNDGTSFSSGFDKNDGPEKAFDDNDNNYWRGRPTDAGFFWVGMEWNSANAKAVKCVSVLIKEGSEVSNFFNSSMGKQHKYFPECYDS